jgi:hypothetical protein
MFWRWIDYICVQLVWIGEVWLYVIDYTIMKLHYLCLEMLLLVVHLNKQLILGGRIK